MSVVGLVIFLVLASTFGRIEPCAAQATASSTDEEARRLFEAGNIAFNDGRYESALTRFREAYELSGRPALLYNIAVCLDRLRRDAEAIEAYQAYLDASPDAENRAEIEGRLRAMREALARQAVAIHDDERSAEEERETSLGDAGREDAEATGGASHASGSTPTDRTESGGDVSDYWWAFVLGGVAVAAAIVVPVVVVSSSSPGTEPPIAGNFGPGTVLMALQVRP